MVGALLRAQSGCTPCTVSNSLAPGTFDPPFLTLQVGQDTEVVIQFALPEDIRVDVAGFAISIYPNFAVFVDSLRMDGGNSYVSLRGNPSVAPSYNSANPAAGALRFDQPHRYKQVRDATPQYENVVVYQNPGGGTSTNPTPPRGCVRACVRGVSPTPTADTLRILLRAFVDTSSISLGFPPSGRDINNKDTTNLMPRINSPIGGSVPAWVDTSTKYAVRVVDQTSVIVQGCIREVKIMPNPAMGVAYLRYALNQQAQVELRVVTPAGQEVLRENLGERPAGESDYFFYLPTGLYVVELKAQGSVFRQRLVVVE